MNDKTPAVIERMKAKLARNAADPSRYLLNGKLFIVNSGDAQEIVSHAHAQQLQIEKLQARIDDFHRALHRVWLHDQRIDDPKLDGTGDDARSPTGDDYNDVLSILGAHHTQGVPFTPKF